MTAITWLGHATMHIVTPAGTSIVIDPWLDGNPAHPKGAKIDAVDVILCTHGHSDHIGSAVELAKKHSAKVICMPELGAHFANHGVKDVFGMNIGGQQQAAPDVNVVMTDATHSSGVEENGSTVEGGDPAGYVLEIADGPTLYHAGDTGVFGDMGLLADLYAPKIAMLPIGDYYTMGPRQAALAAELLGNPVVLPMHFGTFPVLVGTPEALEAEIRKRGGSAQVVHWKPGDTHRA